MRGLFAAGSSRHAEEHTREADHCSVNNRDEHDDQRNADHRQEIAAAPRRHLQRHRRHVEPNHQASAIAERDRGRMEVVNKKSRDAAEQDDDIVGLEHELRALGNRHHARKKCGAGNKGNAGTQPVHVVEQVECARDPDDPEDRQDVVDNERICPVKPQVEE
jgi:hypothetical protein